MGALRWTRVSQSACYDEQFGRREKIPVVGLTTGWRVKRCTT